MSKKRKRLLAPFSIEQAAAPKTYANWNHGAPLHNHGLEKGAPIFYR